MGWGPEVEVLFLVIGLGGVMIEGTVDPGGAVEAFSGLSVFTAHPGHR